MTVRENSALRAVGFSLIEMTVVMVVLGILAAVFAPRTNNDAIVLSTQAEQFAADIRYVQSLAMTQGWTAASPPASTRYRISYTASTYTFYDWSGIAVGHPSGNPSPIALSANVRITLPATGLPNNLVGFDGLGAPYTDSNVTTKLGSTATITLVSGSSTRTIKIIPETGMVYLP